MSPLAPGRVVAGAYRLEQLIGRGGMGTVWEATTLATGERVALKALAQEFAEVPDLRRRFLREARAGSAWRHPNVVHVLGVVDDQDSSPMLLMELLRGVTLRRRLVAAERLSVAEVHAILDPALDAVIAAHGLGIVHRDLKPENVFLARRPWGDTIKVLDFGLAKLTAELGPLRGTAALTRPGQSLGTVAYMAPEQMFGDPSIDYRADVWSLGAMTYECLSGGCPVEGTTVTQAARHLHTYGITPLAAVAPELHPELAAVVTSMLRIRPEERLTDLGVLRLSLRAALGSPG